MTGSILTATMREVGEQPSKLRSFLSVPVERATSGSIFVGAGDSYAAALTTFYLSGGKYLAFDPYAIFTIPSAAAGRDVFFISVSGRTSSNVSAARKLRGLARRRIAITANQDGPLAEEVDDVILLPHESRARVAGTLSFTLALLASMKVALGEFSCNFSRAYSAAKVAQKKAAISDHGTTYILGNNAVHAIAVYGAAKVYEILGYRAYAEQLEEFSHMELFSLKASDSVIIFSAFDPARIGARLHAALRSRGYVASLLDPHSSNTAETIFYYAFLSQLAPLAKAQARGLSEPYLVGARKKLQVSDSMIYQM